MSEPNHLYHQALTANRKLLEENARLKAEVERLRKAGDAVSLCLEAYLYCKPYDGPMTIQCLEAWSAAKEGKPSV